MQRLFILLLGVILGCFGTLIVMVQGEKPEEAIPLSETGVQLEKGEASETNDGENRGLLREELVHRLGSAEHPVRPFIQFYEEAVFDRDWTKVMVTTEVLKEMEAEFVQDAREAVRPGPGTETERAGSGEDRLAIETHRLRRERARRDLEPRTARLLKEHTPEALQELSALLQEEATVESAARALAFWGTSEALTPLLRLLESGTSPERRRIAAEAIGMANRPESFDALAEAFRKEGTTDLRADFIEAMQFLEGVVAGRQEPTAFLVEKLRQNTEDPIRRAVLKVFRKADLPRIPTATRAILEIVEEEESQPVVRSAVHTLTANHERTGETIEGASASVGQRLLRETDRQTRAALIEALKTFGDRNAISTLETARAGAAPEEVSAIGDALKTIRLRTGE